LRPIRGDSNTNSNGRSHCNSYAKHDADGHSYRDNYCYANRYSHCYSQANTNAENWTNAQGPSDSAAAPVERISEIPARRFTCSSTAFTNVSRVSAKRAWTSTESFQPALCIAKQPKFTPEYP
jgi:hypothetical protein